MRLRRQVNNMAEEKNVALKAEEDQKTAVESAYDYLEHFDILETITNVGNDEVFTPRKTCEMILDSLPEEVWHNPRYKWLNPASKNGIFEREIAIRLDVGLKGAIPDEETRRKHILQNMIYSLGQTKFTSYVARRTLYYCSEANRKCDGIKASDGHYVNGYAIGNGTWFDDPEGNIKTPRATHSFDSQGKCVYCRVSKDSRYVDSLQREQYAYELIHHKPEDLLAFLQELFFKGDRNMKFDIIIGNPPYQLSDGGAQASARPIYQYFIKNAIALNPKYLSMIVPSRWMTGGKGLEEFRDFFINCNHVKLLHDYANSKVCFPNNDIKGGVCYFLYEPEYLGKAEIHFHDVNGKEFVSNRFLKDGNDDVYIRDQRLVKLKNDVWKNLKSKNIESIASPLRPYGLRGDAMLDPAKYNLPAFSETKIEDGYEVLGLIKLKRTWMYIPKDYPLPRTDGLESYKVFIARNYGAGDIGECPADPVVANPGQLCTETFIQIGAFKTREEADNLLKYIKTKFFRALVSIVKQDQNASKSVYRYVPIQIFSANSDIDWSQNISGIDHQLYQKYCLDESDINYIESNVEEMN